MNGIPNNDTQQYDIQKNAAMQNVIKQNGVKQNDCSYTNLLSHFIYCSAE